MPRLMPRLNNDTRTTNLHPGSAVIVAAIGLAWLAASESSHAQDAVKAAATGRSVAMDRYGDALPEGALARLGTTRLRHGADVTFVAFGPDGKTVVTAGDDNTIRLWDLANGQELRRFARPQSAPGKPAKRAGEMKANINMAFEMALGNNGPSFNVALAPDRKTLAASAGVGVGEAFQSTLKLAAAPSSITFLVQRLRPAAVVDPQTIAAWITDLSSEKFAVRQKAAANLLGSGPQVVPALRKSLAGASLETRRRAEALLDQLTGGTLTADELRLVRAIEALERMATPPAAGLLRTLAGGAAGALPTREAEAALVRLGRK